jgi:Holliday junction resolvasome RuvABC endonuclease subunit
VRVIVLSFDPGTNETGWCSLDVRGGSGGLPITATYRDAGKVQSTPGELGLLMRVQAPDVIGIERLEGFAFGAGKGPGVVAALVSSSRISGMITALAYAQRISTVEMTAREWRQLVLGNPSATDHRIADVVPRLIHGWPPRSNVHTRDAGGLGLGIAWHLGGRAPAKLDGGREIAQ